MKRALRWWQRWPEWVGYATAVWSLAYAALGLMWARGGPGFPFGLANDAGAKLTWFPNATAEDARVIAWLGASGALVAILMSLARVTLPSRRPRGVGVLVGLGWTFAAFLWFVVPDFRVLTIVAYAPIILVGMPFDWPQPVRLVDVVPWPVMNQALCIVGGVGWAASSLALRRGLSGACALCGRTTPLPTWQTRESARRWGRWAVGVAVAVPVLYAATRFAWALGVPLGITDDFYREGQAIGLWWRGAALASLAVVGAILTLGLIKPWGEVVPRWVPKFGGRRVKPALAIVPATFVSLIVLSAGLMFFRMGVLGTFTLGRHRVTFDENFGALWPELLWPVWGVALGMAALAYHYRTRQRCRYCGRG